MQKAGNVLCVFLMFTASIVSRKRFEKLIGSQKIARSDKGTIWIRFPDRILLLIIIKSWVHRSLTKINKIIMNELVIKLIIATKMRFQATAKM